MRKLGYLAGAVIFCGCVSGSIPANTTIYEANAYTKTGCKAKLDKLAGASTKLTWVYDGRAGWIDPLLWPVPLVRCKGVLAGASAQTEAPVQPPAHAP